LSLAIYSENLRKPAEKNGKRVKKVKKI